MRGIPISPNLTHDPIPSITLIHIKFVKKHTTILFLTRHIIIDLWQINSFLFPFQESNFCPWLIIRDFFQAPSYPNYIKVIIFNIQYYSQKHIQKLQWLLHQTTHQEPRTAPRRLADIHRRQAVHIRTQKSKESLKHCLAAPFLPPSGFWAET